MIIGALIDAGSDPVYLQEELKKLHIEEEYELTWEKVIKNGITSTKFYVVLNKDLEADTQRPQRSYKDIVAMIEAAGFSEAVEDLAIRIFTRIGKAEAHIHAQPLEEVHFHEVGAVDSIIDIVGTAILIDELNIDQFISAPVPVGSGYIQIEHGKYPVPAPATLEILRCIPLVESELKAELTTPTGAAIVAELAEFYSSMPTMTVNLIGYGAGTKTFPEKPNVLRIVIGEASMDY